MKITEKMLLDEYQHTCVGLSKMSIVKGDDCADHPNVDVIYNDLGKIIGVEV